MAESGLAVSKRREETLAVFISAFQRMHQDLTGGSVDAFRLTYRTNVAGFDEASYSERLTEMRVADKQRTFTHLGPHRDDFRLVCAGLDMRDCASQGEQRAAVLTLVLAEWDYLREKGPKPLLLLDDVMSELDGARRRALIDVVRRGGQVVITTTDLRYFTEDELAQAIVVELTDGGGPDGR
jgi:DNA replication and repair protein RecF